MSPRPSRRVLLQESGRAVAGAVLLGPWQMTARGQAPPSERVRVGLIGCGGRGNALLEYFLQARAQCAAVADPDDHRARQAARIVTDRGGPPPETSRDFRRILDRRDIDAVIVATPDHWHAICSVQAAMAGKDIYVEKPVGHNIREGRAMVKAARRYDRVMQVGTQQRAGEHYARAKAFLDAGKLGRVCLCRAWRAIHRKDLGFPEDEPPPPHVDYDLWLGPAPKRPFNRNRFHYEWRWFWDYGGGKQVDWGVHLMDVVHWFMNVQAPMAVASFGGRHILRENTETPDTQTTIFEYPGFHCIWEHRMGNAAPLHDGDAAVAFYGENGTLFISRSRWTVYPERERMPEPPREERGDWEAAMTTRHVEDFLGCVKTRARPAADIEVAHRSTSACQLGNIALRTGRRIRWDAEKEEIVDDREAAGLLTREYRAPWELPVI